MKIEQQNLVNALLKAKLKLPKNLKSFIYNETDFKTNKTLKKSRYLNVLEEWNSLLILRTFAFIATSANRKYKDIKVQEICRRCESLPVVLVCNSEYYFMNRYIYYTQTGEWDKNACYTVSSGNWWFNYDYNMYDCQDWINKLNIPYCQYFNPLNNSYLSFFEYICLYRKYPKIELLVKNNWSNLLKCARLFNFEENKFEKIFKIPIYWKNYMHKLDYNTICYIRKHNLHHYFELYLMESYNYSNIKKYYSNNMLKYVEKNNIDVAIYNDYLSFANTLGMDMNNKKILFPSNLKIEHDILMAKITAENDKKFNGGILKTYKKLKKYAYSDNKYIIRPVKENSELRLESQELGHCVRTYADKVSLGNTGIMVIRKNNDLNTPFVTVELQKKKVIQAKAKDNSLPDTEVLSFIKTWENKFRLTGY